MRPVEVKTSSACGGCGLPFCSTKHKKLLWVSHKHLCKADPDACYIPPLTQREAAALKTTAGKPGSLFAEFTAPFRRKGVVLDRLTQLPCPVHEPIRSTTLAVLRHPDDLYCSNLTEPDFEPWTHVCSLNVHVGFSLPDGTDTFRALNTLYRQYLIFWTLSYQRKRGKLLDMDMYQLTPISSSRLFAEIDRSVLPPAQKQDLKDKLNWSLKYAADHARELGLAADR
ncbi:hypothetical protein JCM10213_007861 [Rhodosporidiobolus nylandii]